MSDPRIEPKPVPPEKKPLDPSKDANPRGKRDAEPVKPNQSQGGNATKT